MTTVNEWWAEQDARQKAFSKSSKGRISKARQMLAQRKMSATTNIQNNLKSGTMNPSQAIRANADYARLYNDAPSEMGRINNILLRGGVSQRGLR